MPQVLYAPKTLHYIVPQTTVKSLVVYCSDQRFDAATRQFLTHELHLYQGEYYPTVIAGGPVFLAHPEKFPADFHRLKSNFELFCKHHPTIHTLHLIGHQDCAFYQEHRQRIRANGASLEKRARADLIRLITQPPESVKRLLQKTGIQRVLAHFATFSSGDPYSIFFEPILS